MGTTSNATNRITTRKSTWYHRAPNNQPAPNPGAILHIERIPTSDLLNTNTPGDGYTIHCDTYPLERVGFSRILLQTHADDENSPVYDITQGFTSTRSKRHYTWSISGTKLTELQDLIHANTTEDNSGDTPVLLLVTERTSYWAPPAVILAILAAEGAPFA
jgi:hypothetical protein